MRSVIVWMLRRVTGRTQPARYRAEEIHREMGLMPDGSPGGFVVPAGSIFIVGCATESLCKCGDPDCPGFVRRPMADHIAVPDDLSEIGEG